MSKQDRQGARTIEQLNGQYGKTFAQAYGLAQEAKKHAEKAEEAAKIGQAEFKTEVKRLDDSIVMTAQKTIQVEGTANAANSTANAAKDSASAANGKAENAEKTAGDALEKAKNTEATVTTKLADMKLTSDGLAVSVTEIRETVDKKAEKAQVEELTEHFRFAEDGMTITNSGTGMGIGVSEKRVVFTGGDNPTTVITPNAMETTNLNVGVRLDVGGFAWLPRSNKNLSLRWVGG